MRAKKLLFIVWVVIAASSLAATVFGKSGILAMRRLQSERDRLAENMRELRGLNEELEGALGSLRSDPDALSVYARELGYAASSEERFIRVSGLPAATRRTSPAGNLLKAVRPEAVPDEGIRVFAALSGIAALIALLPLKPKSRRRRGSAF